MKRTPAKGTNTKILRSLDDELESALEWLKDHSSKSARDGMARYAIPSDNALGVSVANIRVLGKRIGRNHELAAALWKTGIYEARMRIVCRRSGAGDARADGPLVPRLRQLGDLRSRHPLLLEQATGRKARIASVRSSV